MKYDIVSPDKIRAIFANAMSEMYREEVPAYSELVTLVNDINTGILSNARRNDDTRLEHIEPRLTEERHGAIRVGTAKELALLQRAFAVMGMFPVGYYDLSMAGLPVHATAFRPIAPKSLESNPFRIFTSLLRTDFIEDEQTRAIVISTLEKRQIMSSSAIEFITLAEQQRGLYSEQISPFIEELIKTFQWHSHAHVSFQTYQTLLSIHPLIADIVSFSGPHINHLTPRILDIEKIQIQMPQHGITPKERIEGPPPRDCPILLRQTSFKAIEEPIIFPAPDDENSIPVHRGSHTARFGEIEQRGVALTRKGRALYDQCLSAVGHPQQDYDKHLSKAFEIFPDDWESLRRHEFAYFEYKLTDHGKACANGGGVDLSFEDMISDGLINYIPITYEDFLPVSAAGIFRSNLSTTPELKTQIHADHTDFEDALGTSVFDPFQLYAQQEENSRKACCKSLQPHRYEA